MFEKEAEEWFEKLKQAKVPYTNENVNKQLHKAFKDGAEFGYNKANEWHDLRKNPNDLPPFNIKVNVYHRWGKVEIGKREKYSLARNGWLWSMCSDRFRYTSDDENVFAWCEIPRFEEADK